MVRPRIRVDESAGSRKSASRKTPFPPKPNGKRQCSLIFYFMYIFSHQMFSFPFCLLLLFVLPAFCVLFYLAIGFVNNLFLRLGLY